MPRTLIYNLSLVFTTALLTACGGSSVIFEEQDSAPGEHRDLSSVPDAVPRDEPRSRYGNPSSYVVHGQRYHVLDSSQGFTQRGIASWYGTKFHGRRTSSGEPYNMYAMTAAHKSLPLPTYVEVTNLRNNRRVIVKVNDRGPFHANRIIDLSYAAATRLGIAGNGTGLVEIRAINPAAPPVPVQAEAVKPAPATTVADQANAAVATATTGSEPSMYLQVGAFVSPDNARRLTDRLHNAAFDHASISKADTAGNTVYRVRIGPLATVEEADQIVDQLAALGINEARVVID